MKIQNSLDIFYQPGQYLASTKYSEQSTKYSVLNTQYYHKHFSSTNLNEALEVGVVGVVFLRTVFD